MKKGICILFFLVTFLFSQGKDGNISSLELFLFKIGFKGLLKDVSDLKEKSNLSEKEFILLTNKVEYIYNEITKDKIGLEKLSKDKNSVKQVENQEKLKLKITLLENKINLLENKLIKVMRTNKRENKNIKDNINREEKQKKEIQHNSEFSEKIKSFLSTPRGYYTLNLTTENSIKKSKHFLKKYNLLDEGYAFRYGKNLEKTKILYGIYSTYKEAKNSLNNLDINLKNRHHPYIDNIIKHQNIYNKSR